MWWWVITGVIVVAVVVLGLAGLAVARRVPALLAAMRRLQQRGEQAQELQADVTALAGQMAGLQDQLASVQEAVARAQQRRAGRG